MTNHKSFLLTAITLLVFSVCSKACNPPSDLRGNGIQFTTNKGQILDTKGNLRPDILFKGRGCLSGKKESCADIYLRTTGISYVLNNMGEINSNLEEQVD